MYHKPDKLQALGGAPRDSSTPTGRVKITGRPGIRDYVMSPINGPDKTSQNDEEYCDCDHSSGEGSNMYSEKLYRKESIQYCTTCGRRCPDLQSDVAKSPGNNNSNIVGKMFIGLAGALLISLCFNYAVSDDKQKSCSLRDISKAFPMRTKDFWLSIETALNDIDQFNKPKTIIFLYEPKNSARIDDLLDSLSNAAKCWISSSDSAPIQLKPSDLNSKDIIDDYGKVITLYRERLKDSGVMIVRNLDRIPGRVAQAFHTFCDEYTPMVERALFLFTVEVPAHPGNKLKYLEEDLRGKWGDLPEEKFYPLFTRITDIVLEVEEN